MLFRRPHKQVNVALVLIEFENYRVRSSKPRLRKGCNKVFGKACRQEVAVVGLYGWVSQCDVRESSFQTKS